MDIYAPCALGATLNEETISRLKCSIVAGGANNQLKDEKEDVKRLDARDILYAPDFLINSGVINCYIEVIGEYNRDKAFEGCESESTVERKRPCIMPQLMVCLHMTRLWP